MVLLDLERPFIERQNYVCAVPLNMEYIFYIQSNCIFHVFLNLLNHARLQVWRTNKCHRLSGLCINLQLQTFAVCLHAQVCVSPYVYAKSTCILLEALVSCVLENTNQFLSDALLFTLCSCLSLPDSPFLLWAVPAIPDVILSLTLVSVRPFPCYSWSTSLPLFPFPLSVRPPF